MGERAMVDAVAIAHFAFVLFVAFGGFLVLRWRRLAWIHLPAVAWGALIEVFQWNCPLTSVENALRARAGVAGYGDGFIAHYLFRAIYPSGLTYGMQIAIAVFVTAINTAIYARVFPIRRRSRRAARFLL